MHITVPTDFVSSTMSLVSSLFGDFSGIFTFIIAILGLGLVFSIIIGAIHGKGH